MTQWKTISIGWDSLGCFSLANWEEDEKFSLAKLLGKITSPGKGSTCIFLSYCDGDDEPVNKIYWHVHMKIMFLDAARSLDSNSIYIDN